MIRAISDLVAWLAVAPPGTMLSAESLRAQLGDITPENTIASPAVVSTTWRERLWTVPADMRLGVLEAAEALGRPKSFVYRHTGKNAGATRLPHRRLDGELVFVAGELRAWIAKNEETIEAGPSAQARLKAVR